MTTKPITRQWPAALSILYLAIRINTANLAPLMDCDEVFNYWEPLHFVIYGTGLQTWEYAPQYALRTYAYIVPMALIAKLYQLLLDVLPPSIIQNLSRLLMLPDTPHTITALGSGNKPLLFALLRSSLAITSSYAELSFLNSIYDAINPNLAYMTAFVQLTSTGNFHANQAYLPSSSAMILWQMSIANQFRERHEWAIFWGLWASLGVGWPFCSIIFLSTGCWALWKAYIDVSKKSKNGSVGSVIHVLLRTLLYAIVIQAVIFSIDYCYYGRLVSPVWNIFLYNARGGGDELYGVEPFSYYVHNIALNFNVVGFLGLISLPILVIKMILRQTSDTNHLKLLGLVPMYIWMAIVLPRPHKEERFLFPTYPMLSFGAAITTDEILALISSLISDKSKNLEGLKNNSRLLLGIFALSPAAIVSIARSLALHHYYTAPLALYHNLFIHLSETTHPSNGEIYYVCTGGEWYRYPSSFFLTETAQLGFLKSSFGGQLPQSFTSLGSKSESLDIQSGNFNDMNEEEVDRYRNIAECSYVVEMVLSESAVEESTEMPECLQYMAADATVSWSRLSTFKYLDAKSTPTLHRVLYLPFGKENKVQYNEYNLYSRGKAIP